MESKTEEDYWEQLQEEIIEDARKVYPEPVIERWLNPTNFGKIQNPQGYAKVGANCGDVIEVSLRIINDRILDAKFMTEGCGPTLAAGSMATELALGRTVREASKINQQMIIETLGGLPEESRHCALLASDTLHEALKDYLMHKREPWKGAYRPH
jgi:nitrogen fixation protein NifU and related proteins